MTIERDAPGREKRLFECTVIPFRGAEPSRREPLPALAPSAARPARTLRPGDFPLRLLRLLRLLLLLLPVIAPLIVMILLGLLGWFVAWLAIVGLLVAAIVLADIVRAVLWRLKPTAIRALDRQAVSYQGH